MSKTTLKDVVKIVTDYIKTQTELVIHDDIVWKNHYDSVIESLETEIKNTKDIILDYKDDNLTINHIEMEGYLRGLLTMTRQFKASASEIQ